MNIRYWLAGLFVIILGLPTSQCLADDPADEPILGRAEPIGVLFVATVTEEAADSDSDLQPSLGPMESIGRLILSGSIDEECEEVSNFAVNLLGVMGEETPELGPPVLLASLIPNDLNVLPCPLTIHPDEIQGRLREASLLLEALGLIEESREIHKVISKIDREHYERLLLKQREAELAFLQAEVDQLRESIGQTNHPPEVVVTVRIAEIHDKVASGLLTPENQGPANWQDLEEMIKSGTATIVSQPTLIVASKQTGHFQRGGEIHDSMISQAGATTLREYETTVDATPEVLDGNRIRLTVSADRKELNHANSATRSPSTCKQGVKTTLELTAGQTCLLGYAINTSHSGETVVSGTVFAVSVDLVPSMLPVPASGTSKTN